MYLVSLSANSFIWTRAAFCRFDCSANSGLVSVAIGNSGTGQRMSQETSEGKVGGWQSLGKIGLGNAMWSNGPHHQVIPDCYMHQENCQNSDECLKCWNTSCLIVWSSGQFQNTNYLIGWLSSQHWNTGHLVIWLAWHVLIGQFQGLA